jgi:hypothetical protein
MKVAKLYNGVVNSSARVTYRNEYNDYTSKDITILTNRLNSNIRNIQASRLSNVIKRLQISNLIRRYNIDVANIRNRIKSTEFSVQSIKNRKALLIGLNYINSPYELNGCINDTIIMSNLLKNYNFTNIQLLNDTTDKKPTKQIIMNEIKNLLTSSQTGDLLFLLYSGHGSYTLDRNSDERDRRDEMIIPLDYNPILDDELKTLITTNLKKDVTLIALFDSCFSGTMLDLRFQYMDSSNYDLFTENTKNTECKGNVLMISGCMDSQYSEETVLNNKVQGAMSWSFGQCINNNSTWRELLINMRDKLKSSGFRQIPQLSTDSIFNLDTKVFL